MSDYFLTGVALVIFICLIILIAQKNQANEKHFDEMQLIIRANGYKTGFFVTLAGLIALIFLMEGEGGLNTVMEPSFAMFVVFMAGIVTFCVYCIKKGAFFSLDEKGNFYSILCLIVTIVNGILFISRIVDGTLLENGKITFEKGASLVNGLSFFIILIALILKKTLWSKEDEA